MDTDTGYSYLIGAAAGDSGGGAQWRTGPRRPHAPNGTEAGSYLRLIDNCITQLEAEGPSRTCNENKEEEERVLQRPSEEGAP